MKNIKWMKAGMYVLGFWAYVGAFLEKVSAAVQGAHL